MEIKIPFTDKTFTGELRWNFPETEEQKEQIAFNNSIVNVVLLVMSLSGILAALSFIGVFVQCCRRELMLYTVREKFDLVSVMLQAMVVVFFIFVIFDTIFDFRISIARLIVWGCIAFYIYTWRAEIKAFYTYVKSKPWF